MRNEKYENVEPFEAFETPDQESARFEQNKVSDESQISMEAIAKNARNAQDLSTPLSRVVRRDIVITDGYDPHELAPELWRYVAEANQPPRLFLSDSGSVRIEIVDGRPIVNELTNDRLKQEIHRVVRFQGKRGFKPCPQPLVTEMRAIVFEQIPLPRLRQVATAPMIAGDDGKIVTENGYHEDLGVFLWCSEPISAVPQSPSAEELANAVRIINEPLQDFPFVGESSKATALAIMLTPFVRRLIHGATPLHLIEKATPGTGASLLTDALLTPSVGSAVQKLTPPTQETEWKYSLEAVLRGLPAAVVIDNVRELTSVSLAKTLTDDVLVTRLVGSSNTAALPVMCVWVGTGNNPTLHQEIARRSIRCQLDAGVEQPWLGRTFQISNLKDWLREHRPEMVWAVLTIIRSWLVAGQPKAAKTVGMFESYCQVVGGILEHAGIEGFLGDGAFVASGEDLQTEAERWFITLWWARFKDSNVRVTDLLECVTQAGSPVLDLWGPSTRQEAYAKRLGWFIRGLLGKTITAQDTATGGRGETVKIVKHEDHPVSRTAQYRLERLRSEGRLRVE
jgi:hypothetical protein